MIDYALRKPRQLEYAAGITLTIVLASIALGVAGIGSEIVYSNAQTSGYSAGSIGWAVGYVLLVLALPLLLARARHKSASRGIGRFMRTASAISLLVELLFLPIALVIFAM